MKDQLLQPIGSISVSNDGQCLLVSTLDNQIRLLEHSDGSELTSYFGHTNKSLACVQREGWNNMRRFQAPNCGHFQSEGFDIQGE